MRLAHALRCHRLDSCSAHAELGGTDSAATARKGEDNMRAIWTGEIAFGLVAIPVRLYSATKDLSPHFHLVHKVCGTRVQNVRWCPHCNVAVPWEDIVKGYEVSKGRYAKFEKK